MLFFRLNRTQIDLHFQEAQPPTKHLYCNQSAAWFEFFNLHINHFCLPTIQVSVHLWLGDKRSTVGTSSIFSIALWFGWLKSEKAIAFDIIHQQIYALEDKYIKLCASLCINRPQQAFILQKLCSIRIDENSYYEFLLLHIDAIHIFTWIARNIFCNKGLQILFVSFSFSFSFIERHDFYVFSYIVRRWMWVCLLGWNFAKWMHLYRSRITRIILQLCYCCLSCIYKF